MAKSLFKPVLKTVGKEVDSDTGKSISNVLNKQAINRAAFLVTDAIMGENMKEGLKRKKIYSSKSCRGATKPETISKGKKYNGQLRHLDLEL